MARNPKKYPLDVLRHSTAHVMAAAVQDLYPGTKFGIGPSIEDGFYYDIELPEGASLTLEDLEALDAKMRELVEADEPFERHEVSKDEARMLFADQPFKLELIDELPAQSGSSELPTQSGQSEQSRPPEQSRLPDEREEVVSVYTCGTFTDLCRGPHTETTGYLKHFKLMKLAGAYWHGDSTRPMLQRIYGTAWQKAGQLEDYLTRLEEAEKRDHRKLGKELDLFSFSELGGPGFPLYHPKGARALRLLQDWLRDILYQRGYVEAITPHVYRVDMWKMSGHYNNYKDNMYFFNITKSFDVAYCYHSRN